MNTIVLKKNKWIYPATAVTALELEIGRLREALEGIAALYIPEADRESYWLNRSQADCVRELVSVTLIAREAIREKA